MQVYLVIVISKHMHSSSGGVFLGENNFQLFFLFNACFCFHVIFF